MSNNTFQIVDLSASTYCVEEIPAYETEKKLQDSLQENLTLSRKVRELEDRLAKTAQLNKTEAKLQKALQNTIISSNMTLLEDTMRSTIQGEHGEVEVQEAVEENLLLSKKVQSLEESLRSVSSELKVSERTVENLKRTVELMSHERSRGSSGEERKESSRTLKKSLEKGNSSEKSEMEKKNLELWEKLTRLESEFNSQKLHVKRLMGENELLSSALTGLKMKGTPYDEIISKLKKQKKVKSGICMSFGVLLTLLFIALASFVFYRDFYQNIQSLSEL